MTVRSHSLALDLLHYLVVAFTLSTPFWLDWRILAACMFVYSLVFTHLVGYCPVTRWQYGVTDTGFVERHLNLFLTALHITIPKPQLQLFIKYGIPTLLVLTALFVQS